VHRESAQKFARSLQARARKALALRVQLRPPRVVVASVVTADRVSREGETVEGGDSRRANLKDTAELILPPPGAISH